MVSVGGLASGLDTNSIISQLVELERRPIATWQEDIAQLQQFQATYTTLSTDLSALAAAASSFSLDNLDAPAATISGDSVTQFSVSAGASAKDGSHELEITQLATANRIASQGFATSDSSPISSAAGSFAIRLGNSGGQISVSVTTTTSMDDLAQSINAAGGDITASVIGDGTNSLSNRLVLTANETGRDNEIQIVGNDTDLDFTNNLIEAAAEDEDNAGTYTGTVTSGGTYTGTTNKTYIVEITTAGAADGAAQYRYSEDGGVTFTTGVTPTSGAAAIGSDGVTVSFSNSGTFTEGDRFYIDAQSPVLEQAQDAIFTLNGITQTRESNSVTDAIEGVTIELNDTVANTNFRISRDDSSIVSAVEDFVSAYNDVFNEIRNQQTFDTDTFEAGLLLGDRTANSILSLLRTSVSRQVTDLSDYDSLASLGIISSRTGGLEFDSSRLQTALTDSREAVLAVLASTESTSVSTLSVANRLETGQDGDFAVNVTTAPEVAGVVASGSQTDTLTSAEVLSFTYSSNNTSSSPTTSSFSVSLEAGDTLDQVIDRLNSAFATQGVSLTAFSSLDTLNIQTTEYGEDQFFSVTSDTASGAGTTRIDNVTPLSDSGVDIVGTIGGQSSSGVGNLLEVNDGESLDGLSVLYTGTTTGLAGTVTLSTGAGSIFDNIVEQISSGTSSIIGVRNSAIQEEIDALEERILNREEQVARTQTRLEEDFAALEVELAGLQSQSDFLTNQLSQLSRQSSES